jgi:hypothetical protein
VNSIYYFFFNVDLCFEYSLWLLMPMADCFYADWQVGAGEPNGFKSITAFYPGEASSSNGSFLMDPCIQYFIPHY